MQKLPVEYPADAAGIVVQIYAEGSTAEKKLDLVEALWNLIGWTVWHEHLGVANNTYLFTLPDKASDADVIGTLKSFNDLPSHEKMGGKLPFDYEKLRIWAQELIGRLI